ncbi:hypothetical protein FACS189449_01890 [Alphaproteobacteria bacterium]|nr:hypothetical protein FACS189449_01890 [Alphaproteobacteria bacterium]
MSKIKIVAALVLCGVVLSPSLEAMEDGNPIPKYTVLKLCDLIGRDCHGSKENDNIRNLIGMCNEHFQHITHGAFLIGRKRMAANVHRCRPILAARMLSAQPAPVVAPYAGGAAGPEYANHWNAVLAARFDEIGRMCFCNQHALNNVFSAAVSDIAVPLIKDLFILDKLGNDCACEILQAAAGALVDRMRPVAERRAGLDVVRFLIERRVADYDALHYFWDPYFATDQIFTNETRWELTRLMRERGGLDVNHVWPCWPDGYETIRDMNPDDANEPFLDSIGARKFKDLPKWKKDEAIARIALERGPH